MFLSGKWRDYVVHDENNIKGLFGEYRWASNFHICPVWFDGLLYTSTEAAYQSAKTLDMEKRKEFTTMEPLESMRAGRALEKTPYFRADWNDVKYDVMSSCIFDKFYRNMDLREKLLATGSKNIEEANHWDDIYWGVCEGFGESNLGKVLMGIRNYWKLKEVAKEPTVKRLQEELFDFFHKAILESQAAGKLTENGFKAVHKMVEFLYGRQDRIVGKHFEEIKETIIMAALSATHKALTTYKNTGSAKKCCFYFRIVIRSEVYKQIASETNRDIS